MAASVVITKNEFAEKGVSNGTNRMIREACIKIAAQAKTLCPHDKGQLENSIMTNTNFGPELFNNVGGDSAPNDQQITSKPIDTENKKAGFVGTNSDHWYPEFGTRNMDAQPFLRPAKEIVMDGGKASQIAKKYSSEEMTKAYRSKKVTVKKIG